MQRESLAERIRQQAERETATLTDQQIEQAARILAPVLTAGREVKPPRLVVVDQ